MFENTWMSRKVVGAIAGAALIVSLIGGFAAAQVAETQASSVIKACINTTNGQDGAAGPAGPAGPKGDTGPLGPQGDSWT